MSRLPGRQGRRRRYSQGIRGSFDRHETDKSDEWLIGPQLIKSAMIKLITQPCRVSAAIERGSQLLRTSCRQSSELKGYGEALLARRGPLVVPDR